jgi:hypothetical protein
MRVVADITDPNIIQRILDHIQDQPPPLQTATVIHAQNTLSLLIQAQAFFDPAVIGEASNKGPIGLQFFKI